MLTIEAYHPVVYCYPFHVDNQGMVRVFVTMGISRIEHEKSKRCRARYSYFDVLILAPGVL